MDHPKPWLRYVDASKVSDRTLELYGLKVRNGSHEDLGTVDGLIVDSQSGRPYYIVVDAGGWFTSKQFLVPIGRISLDNDRDAFVVTLSKEQIGRFPGFDTDEFDKLTEADIKRINDRIGEVYEPNVVYPENEPYTAAWSRSSYHLPEWWHTEIKADADDLGSTEEGMSPHFDGRAQPGDVLGLETDGERTYVGDTKKDEVERRHSAMDAARKAR